MTITAELFKFYVLSPTVHFVPIFVSFLYSFPTISDILAHNGMLDKDAFDIEKLRISCKINLINFISQKLYNYL